ANLLMLLGSQVKSIRIHDQGGRSVPLSSTLSLPGLDESLLPYPDNAFPAFSWMQELLFLPQKFLFVELTDLHKARGTLQGERFRLEIIFHKSSFTVPEITARSFALNVTPAVNLFPIEA